MPDCMVKLKLINSKKLKPINYNTAPVVSTYLKPLCKMSIQLVAFKVFLTKFQLFPFGRRWGQRFIDVESLFINILVKETINYITDIVTSRVKVTEFKCYGCPKNKVKIEKFQWSW